MGKDLEEEPGPPVNIGGTKKALGQGKRKIDPPETKGNLFVGIGSNGRRMRNEE
jgi:hypothetical protein